MNLGLPHRWQTFLRKIAPIYLARVDQWYRNPQNYKAGGLWIAAIVASLVSVAYTKCFQLAELAFHNLLAYHPVLIFIASPALFLIAWFLVMRFAPEASGSGIPQIMAANEMDYDGPQRHRVDVLLSLKTSAIKILSSLLCVAGGGAIGREGPTLQISASVFHFFGKLVRRTGCSTSEHTWVVAGAAAGLASAFNTPLGGIVYAIEELGLVHFQKVRTALLGGVIVSGLVAQSILGSYLYVGTPVLAKFGLAMIPFAIVVGVLTGIGGGVFGSILFFALKCRLKLSSKRYLAMATLGCGLLSAALIYVEHRAAGTGVNVINGLLFHGEPSSLFLVFSRYFSTMIAYLSGAAGGIFSPSLAIGAAIGRFLAYFCAADHSNLMIMLGMIGFLTGVTRTPFTAFILVLEMTDRHSAIFPMMVTALTSYAFARLIDRQSFYEHVKETLYLKN